MADFRQFAVTKQADAVVGVAIPRFSIAARVVKDDGSQIDLTGANSIDFAFRVQGLNVAGHRELVDLIAHWLVRKMSGTDA